MRKYPARCADADRAPPPISVQTGVRRKREALDDAINRGHHPDDITLMTRLKAFIHFSSNSLGYVPF
jgi:hypothetical protein